MIGIIGDLHLKENLGYSECISDRRVGEKKEVLDFIVDQFKDYDSIIFMGDQLNSKNNPSEVIREFVHFLERFPDKHLYLLAGNHEKWGNGKSAIDFLKEIKNPKWHVITNVPTMKIIGRERTTFAMFCPYMTKSELLADNNEEATMALMSELLAKKHKLLFVHHAISGSKTVTNQMTDMFDEIVLPAETLLTKYDMVFAGHIHQPQVSERVVISGSVFNNEAGDHGKSIFSYNEENGELKAIPLPGRPIYKLDDPSPEDIMALPKNSIVKVVLTEKKEEGFASKIRQMLREYVECGILIERYPNERKKVHIEDGTLNFGDTEELLRLYAQEKKIDFSKLKTAWEEVKN